MESGHLHMNTMALHSLLSYYAKSWQLSLHMERTLGRELRMPFSFPDIDRFGEALFGVLYGLRGSGTKGSGADLVDAKSTFQDEVKTVNLCQPSKCNECQRRSPWSDEVCAHCGSKDIERIGDSRFGINAAAHLKDAATLRHYLVCAIEHRDGDTFCVTGWRIRANDPYFVGYINEQSKQVSKTCNLLPRSFDFVMSGATQVVQFTLNLPTDPDAKPTVGEVDTTEVVDRIPWKVLKKNERELLGLSKDESVSVERAKQVLAPRKKAHGKSRGVTDRHVAAGAGSE